jgi:hypothetical protein
MTPVTSELSGVSDFAGQCLVHMWVRDEVVTGNSPRSSAAGSSRLGIPHQVTSARRAHIYVVALFGGNEKKSEYKSGCQDTRPANQSSN